MPPDAYDQTVHGRDLAKAVAALCAEKPTRWPIGNASSAIAILEAALWPNGPRCGRCDAGLPNMGRIKGHASRWRCSSCRTDSTLRLGTCLEGSQLRLDATCFALRIYGETESEEQVQARLRAAVGVDALTAVRISERIAKGYTRKPRRGTGRKPTPDSDEARLRRKEEVRAREIARADRDRTKSREAAAKRRAKEDQAEAAVKEQASAAEARLDQRLDGLRSEALDAQVTLEARLIDLHKEALDAVGAAEEARPSPWPWAAAVVGAALLTVGASFWNRPVQAALTLDDIPSVYMDTTTLDGVLYHQTIVDSSHRVLTSIEEGESPEEALPRHLTRVDMRRETLLKKKLAWPEQPDSPFSNPAPAATASPK